MPLWRAPLWSARAPPASDEERDDDDSSALSEHPADVNAALLIHEAAAVLNLHAQAVAVQNIRSLIPIVLDMAFGNYTRWREQFLLVLGKYSLQDHVLRSLLSWFPRLVPHGLCRSILALRHHRQ